MSTPFIRSVAGYLWITLILSGLRHEVAGYSTGAPTTSCSSMVPDHGVSSINPCPFQTLLDQEEMLSSDILKLTINTKPSTSNSFKGFLIMAFDTATDQVIGTFRTESSEGKSQTIKCFQSYDAAATHTSNTIKTSVTIEWIPPADFEGVVIFKTTFVENKNTYWAKELSKQVKILPDQNATTITVDPPTMTEKPDMPDIYSGCPGTKGCIATPSDCIKSKNCFMMTTYKKVDDYLELEIYGQVSGDEYVAVGFSADDKMGIDSVVECANYRDKLAAYPSFNTKEKANLRLLESQFSGFSLKYSAFSDGLIYCKVQHPMNYTINDVTFDLRKPQYLLMAMGPTASGNINRHTTERSSSSTVILSEDLEASYLDKNSRILKQLHGSFMVIAWLIAASIGVLMPRYMKRTWVGKQIMKKDRWFVFHQGLMGLAWFLTVAAFIIIFVDVGGWVSESVSENPHPLIGCITTVLAFIQPFMAAFRPLPSSSKRYIFNWAHSLVGYSAHILAITCIFLAVEMKEAELPYETYWILTAYVCVYVIAQLFLTYLARRNASSLIKDNIPRDEKGSSIRKVILAVYVCVVVGLGSTVIVFIGG